MNIINNKNKVIIGMVHCLALPSSANFGGNIEKIIDRAVDDAVTLENAGVDAIIVENMGDSPFGIKLDKAAAIALGIISDRVKKSVSIPVGIDAAMNDYEASLSIAKCINAQFVRIPVFVDTVEFYGGIIPPCAREAISFRKSIDAVNVKILADIQVKHTHMLLPHVSVEDSAIAATGAMADGIIVTGTHIGKETPIDIIKRVKAVTSLPLIAGSGVNCDNVKEQLSIADGAIVGSSLKDGGKIENPISFELTKKLVDEFKGGF